MVCFMMKPMALCGVSAPKNKFLRIPTTHRHHWRGYPYIIYKMCFAFKISSQAMQKFIIATCCDIFLWRKPHFVLRMLRAFGTKVMTTGCEFL